jgi:hypothetical protein
LVTGYLSGFPICQFGVEHGHVIGPTGHIV